ncbi:MAG: hypothetical protein AUK53_07440 [Betaproteobacteria bacterium CG2_30_59_46]|nr:MAG: hypothetical protein AUK53_07440 [Betaproteobacteria bacterium CG2_30_59_46]
MGYSRIRFWLARTKGWGVVVLALFPSLAWGVEIVSGDFQTILNSRADTLKVWNFAENPKIFVFDFPGLTLQGRSFNRITQYTEQAQANTGYPRVLTNEEIAKYMESLRRTQANFAFGHDLLVSELVQFYNLADRDKVGLFSEELALRDFLVEQGLVKVWRSFYQSLQPDVVILSIPQMQPKKVDEPQVSELARRAIFTHEISHGEYYTNRQYATYCRRFWSETLSDAQREAFVNLFKKYNYAVALDELVVNEMQAYLMFTPDPNSFSASKLGITDGELDSMREMFRQGKPPTRLPLY